MNVATESDAIRLKYEALRSRGSSVIAWTAFAKELRAAASAGQRHLERITSRLLSDSSDPRKVISYAADRQYAAVLSEYLQQVASLLAAAEAAITDVSLLPTISTQPVLRAR